MSNSGEDIQPAEKVTDSEGWPILIESYVRVSRSGLKSWRGWVKEFQDNNVLKIRDNDGRTRHARVTEVTVIKPSKSAKRKKSIVAEADQIGAALSKRRRLKT